jgi:hypothetical protein
MTTSATLRSLAGFAAIAILCLFASAAQAQAPISVTPKTVKTGTSPALTVASNGFLDLSQIAASQFSVTPGDGVSGLRVSNPSAQSLILSFDLASGASTGQRSLTISLGDMTVSLKLTVERGLPPACSPRNCRAPRTCVDGVCTAPPPPACSPANCRPPRFCNDEGVCMRRPVCNPACRPPRVCNDSGRCELPM